MAPRRAHDVRRFRGQPDRRQALRLPQRLARLERRELQQPVDDPLDARRFHANVAEKFPPLFLRHALVEQFGRAPDGGQRRLHLVRQRLRVTLDVLPALEGVAHFLERPAEFRDFHGPRAGRKRGLAIPHLARVNREPFERARQPRRDPPPGNRHAERDDRGIGRQPPAR